MNNRIDAIYARQSSGKNTARPQFQMLVEDIKRGLFARVVVYKLDRISRSILDFANMMALFQDVIRATSEKLQIEWNI